MSRIVFAAAFALGLVSIAWVGAGFLGSSAIALAMTVAIGGVYLLGAFELRQFRAASSGLAAALASIPQPLPAVGDWLGELPVSLRTAVRLRVEGERVALPGPALTPYLVGLLVMLGMLGTFLGMVVTFQGAVFALEGSTDLQAIRSALAAPIKGLGLAFGTSVAGVAASAMLGLMSAISRRERADVTRLLDTCMAGVFRPFSLAHQRQETFKALQLQAHALPGVADKLQAMMEGMERRAQQLDTQLLGRQEQFHRDVTVVYTGLAGAVEKSLQDSLAASARAAGESLAPVVAHAMSEIANESRRMHERVSAAAQEQLDGLSTRFGSTVTTLAGTWVGALDKQAQTGEKLVNGLDRSLAAFTDTFQQRSGSLLAGVQQAASESQATLDLAERQRQQAWTQALESMAATLQGEWQRVGAQTLAQQQAVCQALEKTAAEITERAGNQAGRTMDAISQLTARSEDLIRSRIDSEAGWTKHHEDRMDQLASLIGKISVLLQTLNQASVDQRAAIESLVASADAVLDTAGSRFSETLGAQAGRARDVAAQVSGSAIELSSLGESFNHGVQLFSASNEKLMESLQRIEGAIHQSMARSDEQLAYYVAQAREVIDLSITSQQGIVEDLRRLDSRKTALTEASV